MPREIRGISYEVRVKSGLFFYFIGNCVPYEIKTLRAGCARRNRDILPLCGIAAAHKVFKPLKIEGRGR